MDVLTNETVKMVLKRGIASLGKDDDLIISKQIIIAAFSEIIEFRNHSQIPQYEQLLIDNNGKVKWDVTQEIGRSI